MKTNWELYVLAAAYLAGILVMFILPLFSVPGVFHNPEIH